MAHRFVRSFVLRAREHPFALLMTLLGLSAEVVATWLSFTSWTSSGPDANRTALAQAVGELGFTFLLAMLWTTSFRSSLIDTGAADTAVPPDRSRVWRPSAKVRRAAFSMWVVILVLALTQVVAALSGNLGVSFTLGMIVPGLSLIGVVGVAVAVMGRQR